MSQITIIGNLTDQAELRFTQSGRAVANFTVAVNRGKDDNKQTDFYRVAAWQDLGEHMAQLDKGTRVIVHGDMRSRQFEDREGNKRTAWEVTAFAAGPDASWQEVTAVKAARRDGQQGTVGVSGTSSGGWGTPTVAGPQNGAQGVWDDDAPF